MQNRFVYIYNILFHQGPGKCNGVPTNISWLWREVCAGSGEGLGKVLGGRKASAARKEILRLTDTG